MQDHTPPSALENAIAAQKYGVGQPVRRKEDDTLVRGKGKYTDDFSLPGQAYAWIVRSSHAHGLIKGIDTEAAKTMAGVLGVWTGADLASANYNPFTCGLPLKNRDGTPLLQTNRTALATDKVRFVSDPGRLRQQGDPRQDPQCAAGEGPHPDRQCRRLLRHEEPQLSRICLHHACGQGAGPSGEMDRRAFEQLPLRQPGPRAVDPRRAR